MRIFAPYSMCVTTRVSTISLWNTWRGERSRGALQLDEALKAAAEIADALDKAHQQGVIHRDLKPSNVMLTKSGIKLLDFGLAKLKQAELPAAHSTLPYRADVTAHGTILGTLQYMAPEQLEGQDADARTDIFAFGAVLYEMVAGKKAFVGKSQATLISAIVSAEPEPLAKLQPMTSPALEHIVKSCLSKDADDRWQRAHDVMTQLKWIAEGGSQIGIPAPAAAGWRKRERLWWVLLAVTALLVMAMALPTVRYFQGPPEPDEIRFLITTPNLLNNLSPVTISPDGRSVAFIASTSTAARAAVLSPFLKPYSTLSGSQGLSSSFSPATRIYGIKLSACSPANALLKSPSVASTWERRELTGCSAWSWGAERSGFPRGDCITI